MNVAHGKMRLRGGAAAFAASPEFCQAIQEQSQGGALVASKGPLKINSQGPRLQFAAGCSKRRLGPKSIPSFASRPRSIAQARVGLPSALAVHP